MTMDFLRFDADVNNVVSSVAENRAAAVTDPRASRACFSHGYTIIYRIVRIAGRHQPLGEPARQSTTVDSR